MAMSASNLLNKIVQMKLISASHLKCLVMANTVQHNSLKSFLLPEPSDQTKSTEKIALNLKGLPPSHHLIRKGHSITNDDVTCEGCGVSLMELLNTTSKV